MKKRSLKRLILVSIIGFISLTGMKCIVTGPNTTTTVEGQHIDYPQVTTVDYLCEDAPWLCPGWHEPQDYYWEYQKYYHYNGMSMVLDGAQWVGGPCGAVTQGCDFHRVDGAYGFD